MGASKLHKSLKNGSFVNVILRFVIEKERKTSQVPVFFEPSANGSFSFC
jgi:hypothetical protein